MDEMTARDQRFESQFLGRDESAGGVVYHGVVIAEHELRIRTAKEQVDGGFAIDVCDVIVKGPRLDALVVNFPGGLRSLFGVKIKGAAEVVLSEL